MDKLQKNHLKAYGIAYNILAHQVPVDWLLNYKGGSFLVDYYEWTEKECIIKGVSYQVISDAEVNAILLEINSPSTNMNIVRMGRAPKIAVYSPRNDLIDDDTDAVLLVLDFAEIPYDIIYDNEVLDDRLVLYDWLHLHHEDFTGQVDRFSWRPSSVVEAEVQKMNAQRHGYATVSDMKQDVAGKIKVFLAGGGYLFAMCSGAETFDLALSAEDFDTNPFDKSSAYFQPDYSKTLAFRNFTLETGYDRRYSDINVGRGYNQLGYFTLFEFSAKWDIVPAILTQDHERVIQEFSGLTTAFNKDMVKPKATILGENKNNGNVRYIFGEFGQGHWSYYSGHDPERRFSRGRGRQPTDLRMFPNSPGYRLILNNVLFPSTRKKKQKT